MRSFTRQFSSLFLLSIFFLAVSASGQALQTEIPLPQGTVLEIVNHSGRIAAAANANSVERATISASSSVAVTESELKIENIKGRIKITVQPVTRSKRIDLSVHLPERSTAKFSTSDAEIVVSGNFASVGAFTETGTIVADLPADDLKYELVWTASRPRFVADFELPKMRERSAGRFEIKGEYKAPAEETPKRNSSAENEQPDEGNGTERNSANQDRKVTANFSTARGIILLNVPPNEVMSDLRERPLTDAAKAIIRSGDSVLMNAIRRAAPKYFGEYERTLPPVERMPVLTTRERPSGPAANTLRTALVRVTDANNRAIAGLSGNDFELLEGGRPAEIVSVRPVTAHVNLVLLLDVSGSVDNYINFIRKAARSFVETVDARDRISIVLFSEDVKVLSGFTTDKARLSESLDSFDAGGATAYYDALAYTLADTLRPLRGERTAIVVLTDGDDNRSFLAFDSLAGAIEESGALIYPLYVPTGLLAATESSAAAEDIDPLRNRHLTLTSKAASEGPRLATMSGGVYYPITRLSQIQEAYDDIVLQLRTAYEITFRPAEDHEQGRPSPRLRVRTKRTGAFASVESIVQIPNR